MAFEDNTLPEIGGPITINKDGVLVVPDHALVIWDADETWSSVQKVLDAAVEKAYAGTRKIAWTPADQDLSAMDESLEICQIGMKLEDKTSLSSALFSGAMLLGRMHWVPASDLVVKALRDTVQAGVLPQDAELFDFTTQTVALDEFSEAVIAHMGAGVEADQYDELADKFHEEFEAGAEKTAEFAQSAMETARKQLTAAGKFTEDQGQKLKLFLENDFSRVSQEMKAGAKEKLNPSRLGAGALSSMSKLLHKTGVALSSFADRADGALACKSGEITSAGKLKCNACSYEMNFKKTGRIPPCPKCHKTEFTKGY